MCQKTIASLVGESREGRLVYGWIDGTTIQTFLIPDAGRRKSTLLQIISENQINQL